MTEAPWGWRFKDAKLQEGRASGGRLQESSAPGLGVELHEGGASGTRGFLKVALH